MAAPLIKEMVEHGAKVNIMCDSQAAIKALDETTTKSKLVLLVKKIQNIINHQYIIDMILHMVIQVEDSVVEKIIYLL